MIPFSPPYITQEIIDEVVDTLKSGWITTGPKTKLFEKRLAEYCGVDSVLCVNSATSGLEIMLRWFGVKEGDEVIVPAYTYSATANVIIHCGAKPVFADVGQDFNIDPEKVAELITPKTKVIMPVDFGGWPCDYDSLKQIVMDRKGEFNPNTPIQQQLGRIMILSDAAHSFGATQHGKSTGALADCTIFSFHAVKNLTTAEGGAIVFNFPLPFDNAKLYQEFCVKTLHGQNKDALAKTIPGNWKYDIVEAGYKMNMTDLHASIGLVQLKDYNPILLPERKRIFNSYREAFKNDSRFIVPIGKTADSESSYHLFALRIANANQHQRDEIIARIFSKGVSVNVHFIPVPYTGFYQSLGYQMNDYPNALELYSGEITLPLYPGLTDQQIQQVIEATITSVNEVMTGK